MTPAEQLAEAILSAAGSGLRHYTATSRQRIIAAAEAQIASLRATGGLTAHLDDQRHGIGGRGE